MRTLAAGVVAVASALAVVGYSKNPADVSAAAKRQLAASVSAPVPMQPVLTKAVECAIKCKTLYEVKFDTLVPSAGWRGESVRDRQRSESICFDGHLHRVARPKSSAADSRSPSAGGSSGRSRQCRRWGDGAEVIAPLTAQFHADLADRLDLRDRSRSGSFKM